MKTIEIYDFDNTLMTTVKFSDLVKFDQTGLVMHELKYQEYFKKIKSIFSDVFFKEIYFLKKGDYIVVINASTNKPFDSSYYDKLISVNSKYEKMFDVVNNAVTLESFPGFHSDKETVNGEVNLHVIEQYKKSQNKMILSGRPEKLRFHIENYITNELQLELPNYGLNLFPGGSISIKEFKGKTILETIRENNWDEIHFYEDRFDWIEFSEQLVKDNYPQVNFISHLITNVHDEREKF